ncbi:MAG: efflux RND transporter periplasmic adaptor subunit, partial [Cyclobacteriaceae bacterium]|nr:efflux RND transporter periplasmic adaptor subunit [Cyclobacteriaceae bacterium]
SQKAIAQMQQAAAKMMDDKQDVNFFEALLSEFRIMAPESGMVIYQRDWRGQKLGVGASISSWDMTVATLPDLTQMVSKTYVNEIDIRTVKAGQEVMIGLDAFPDKKLTGKVMEVANIGEQKPNTDSKVFQVLIEVNEADTTLRPAMTTSNTIISEVVSEVLFVPLEAVHSQGDSLSYVIVKEGISFKKQEVELGKSNANEIVINRGLAEGNELYLSIPEGAGKKDVVMLDKEEDNNLTINQ